MPVPDSVLLMRFERAVVAPLQVAISFDSRFNVERLSLA